MTPDPKDKILVVGSPGVDHTELLKALGTGVTVATADGTVAMPPAKRVTLEDLQQQLRAMKAKAERSQALRAQVDPRHRPATPPIAGGHHNGQRRNAPCHCGSGRKWKKCCGAPAVGEGIKLVAVAPRKGM